MMNKLYILALVALLGMGSCYKDNEEELYLAIDNNCSPENVSFSKTIYPILSSRCFACHSNDNASSYGDGIPLEDYQDVKNIADQQRLVGSIRHLSGYTAMPKGANSLAECKIVQIEAWIDGGAQNN